MKESENTMNDDPTMIAIYGDNDTTDKELPLYCVYEMPNGGMQKRVLYFDTEKTQLIERVDSKNFSLREVQDKFALIGMQLSPPFLNKIITFIGDLEYEESK